MSLCLLFYKCILNGNEFSFPIWKKVEKNVMKVWKPHNHWVLKTENSFDNAENEISKIGAISIKLIGIKLIK